MTEDQPDRVPSGSPPHRPALSHEQLWRRFDAVEARLCAGISERMLDLAGLANGMRVLDLATGRGEPAWRAALRVAPDGAVLGVDPDAAMLAMARAVADRAGVTNLELRQGVAEALTDLEPGTFDAVTARWGLSYMADPVAALANGRRALRRTGVLVAALWAEPERVEWHSLPRRLLARYRPMPAIEPEAPGPFRFAELARVDRDFARADLSVDHVEEVRVAVVEHADADELLVWSLALGMAPLLADLGEPERRAWEQDLRRELENSRARGVVQLGGVTRIVRAVPR